MNISENNKENILAWYGFRRRGCVLIYKPDQAVIALLIATILVGGLFGFAEERNYFNSLKYHGKTLIAIVLTKEKPADLAQQAPDEDKDAEKKDKATNIQKETLFSTTPATILLAAGALLIGILRWSLSLQETSINSFYERLRASNEFLVEAIKAHKFVENLMTDSIDGDKRENFKRDMWVYIELDNLEFCFEKYAYRFMTVDTAYRALGVFLTRCKNSPFKRYAKDLVNKGKYNLLFDSCRFF